VDDRCEVYFCFHKSGYVIFFSVIFLNRGQVNLRAYIHNLLVVYLTTLSVAHTIWHMLIG
jgi:hypothetical protein